jgi:HD superfamily phosphohydrolase
MEDIMEDRTGMDHMGLARALITGTVPNRLSRDRDLGEEPPPIGEVLEGSGISADTVCDLISYPESRTFSLESFAEGNRASYFPSKDYVHQIIHGPVDADQMDYLIRDAHYTGVSHGSIDTDRLLNTMRVHNDRIVLEKGGISAAEGLMVSRALMYSSVYYHRTVRLAEMMLTKAADTSGLDLSEIYLMSDFDLTSAIISSGGRSSRIVRDLLDRRLYKSALVLYTIDLDEDTSTVLQRYLPYHKRRALEWEIAEAAGVDDQDVLVDIPLKSALMDMAKIGKTDVSILDREGRVRSITKYSPIAKALQTRDTLDWAMAVSAPRGKREAVERAARKVLSL